MKNYLPFLVWALIILFLSTETSVQLPESVFSIDKLGHFGAYFILEFLALWALLRNGRLNGKTILATFLLTSGYGIILEFVQWKFYPNRFFEVWDMIANITGVLMATFLFYGKKTIKADRIEN